MQNLLDLLSPAPQTFDNFIIGKNQECINKLTQLVKDYSKNIKLGLFTTNSNNLKNCFYIWGDYGCGCSHLLQAFCNNTNLTLINYGELENETTTKYLVIDNVNKPSTNYELNRQLFSLIRKAEIGEIKLLIAGDCAPRNLQLPPEICTRLTKMSVFQIHRLTDDEKVMALLKHASSNSFNVDEKTVRFFMQNFPRDMRILISLLDKFDKWTLQVKAQPTLAMAKKMLLETSL